mmetsp:Transcript_22243/g.51316  ORF Transcript_22243/g.51316 Transcript_22243/m.51316 type:complete len:111 (+) Transcript_22243:75-407(+)
MSSSITTSASASPASAAASGAAPSSAVSFSDSITTISFSPHHDSFSELYYSGSEIEAMRTDAELEKRSPIWNGLHQELSSSRTLNHVVPIVKKTVEWENTIRANKQPQQA